MDTQELIEKQNDLRQIKEKNRVLRLDCLRLASQLTKIREGEENKYPRVPESLSCDETIEAAKKYFFFINK
jgi:hypothetical protein